jgi:2,3-bisphosphoglycerate-dependent phosphoglycerate mutase
MEMAMTGIRRRGLRTSCFLLAIALTLALPEWARTQPPEILRVYVARHGQTDWNLEGRLQGGTDIPLNATGRQQAVQLGERLKSIRLDAIYSSGLRRSRETAELIGSSAPLTSLPRLNERRLGKFEGQKLARSTTGGGAAGAAPSEDPLTREYDRRLIVPNDPLDGGESLEEFAGRVGQATKELLAGHRSGAILIVGHGMTNQMVLKSLLDLTLDQATGIQMANDELYLVEIGAGGAPRLWKLVTAANLADL